MPKEVDDLGRSYATGKRKDAVARVWLKQGPGNIIINGKSSDDYFARPVLRMLINQPQVGILAIGSIEKKPSVIETNKGDFIGVRRKMILSHSYDHRIINGATGGLFIKRLKEILESWDSNTMI